MLFQSLDINSFYGMSHILFDVSLDLDEGEAVCVLGRNGAGKSTFMKSIMGLIQPRSGSIRFLEQEVVGKQPFEIARMGISYVPEDRIIFPDLTVRENLELTFQRKKGNSAKWDVAQVCNIFIDTFALSRLNLFKMLSFCVTPIL
jgi:branched-chain amino acid transport system ATP-binding protein